MPVRTVKDGRISTPYSDPDYGYGAFGRCSGGAGRTGYKYSADLYSAMTSIWRVSSAGTMTRILYSDNGSTAFASNPMGTIAHFDIVGSAVNLYAGGTLVNSVTDATYAVAGDWQATVGAEVGFVSYDSAGGSFFPLGLLASQSGD